MTSTSTRILFLNHSSVLIQYDHQYLLTDPWYHQPAFGSWLPVPPLVLHPSYIAALSDRLRILISHAHDDHCDESFLGLFDSETPVYSAFGGSSVGDRVKAAGLTNVHTVNSKGRSASPFLLKSYVNRAVSITDAIYTIETPDALIVHANDNWSLLPDPIARLISADVARVGPERCLYMSQSNSASGWPLTYRNYTRSAKRSLLYNKVFKMVSTGLQNCAQLAIPYFLSYAGFAGIFVRNHKEYDDDSLFPTPSYLAEHMSSAIPKGVEVLDLMPGDEFDFVTVRKSFVNTDISPIKLKESARHFYESYGVTGDCDTYEDQESTTQSNRVQIRLRAFLSAFNEYVMKKTASSGFETSILGKSLKIVVEDLNIVEKVHLGPGMTGPERPNKTIYVTSSMLERVLDGRSRFENLYTGYNAEIERDPSEVHNRDIVSYIVMFSDYYRSDVLPRAQSPL